MGTYYIIADPDILKGIYRKINDGSLPKDILINPRCKFIGIEENPQKELESAIKGAGRRKIVLCLHLRFIGDKESIRILLNNIFEKSKGGIIVYPYRILVYTRSQSSLNSINIPGSWQFLRNANFLVDKITDSIYEKRTLDGIPGIIDEEIIKQDGREHGK